MRRKAGSSLDAQNVSGLAYQPLRLALALSATQRQRSSNGPGADGKPSGGCRFSRISSEGSRDAGNAA